jgi:hypothetical protein
MLNVHIAYTYDQHTNVFAEHTPHHHTSLHSTPLHYTTHLFNTAVVASLGTRGMLIAASASFTKPGVGKKVAPEVAVLGTGGNTCLLAVR